MFEMVNNFYEWENWSIIMHNILFALIIYIIYVLIINNKERKFINILLFTNIIGLTVIIHEIINLKNKK